MNILTAKQRCALECDRTWKSSRSMNEPSTSGEVGDVRRCEHGRIWVFDDHATRWDHSGSFDHWTRLSGWENPIQYRRARRALSVVDCSCGCGRRFREVTGWDGYHDIGVPA